MPFIFLKDPEPKVENGNIEFWIDDLGRTIQVLLLLEAMNHVRKLRTKNAKDLTADQTAQIEQAFHENRENAIRRALQRLLDSVERHEQLATGDKLELTRKHFGDEGPTKAERGRS